jgi:hypothetical protein
VSRGVQDSHSKKALTEKVFEDVANKEFDMPELKAYRSNQLALAITLTI